MEIQKGNKMKRDLSMAELWKRFHTTDRMMARNLFNVTLNATG